MSFCTKCGGANDPNAGFCRACGAALPTAVAGTTPGAAVAPAPAAKKSKTGLRVVLILVALFIGLPVVAAIVFGVVMTVKYGDTKKAATDPCDNNSYAYLWALQHGNSIAATYWKAGVTPETLFDVSKFTVIKHGSFLQAGGKPYKIPRVYYQYEVESSTKGGFPIRKRWNIVMESDTKSIGELPCAIVQLAEAQ
jgi:hypothetical protein